LSPFFHKEAGKGSDGILEFPTANLWLLINLAHILQLPTIPPLHFHRFDALPMISFMAMGHLSIAIVVFGRNSTK
jgi:hypothetical protein